jgi:hypothetical protein
MLMKYQSEFAIFLANSGAPSRVFSGGRGRRPQLLRVLA